MPQFKGMAEAPEQIWLMARSLDELVPAESDVRAFREVMERLDFRLLEMSYSEVGRPAYPPRVLAQLMVYAYSKGVRSSRKIEEMAKCDVRYMWLAGGLKPDHQTIARFRRNRFSELSELFTDSVRVCAAAGLVTLRVGAADGTKIEANASRKSLYDQKRIERERQEVQRILEEAEAIDEAEDRAEGVCGGEVPDELRDAEARKARLDEISERLRESKRKAISSSDPECRMMKCDGRIRPGYNVQAVVDADSLVVAAVLVTEAENDHGQLPQLAEMATQSAGTAPGVVVADTGYCDEETLKWVKESGQEVLVPPQKHSQEDKREGDEFSSRRFALDEEKDVMICPKGHELVFKDERTYDSGTYRRYAGTECKGCDSQKVCCRGRPSRQVSISVVHSVRLGMRDKLETAEGKALYALRKQSVEPVFGHWKANLGFRRFLLRGKSGAAAEIALICIAHNVSKCAALGLVLAADVIFGLFSAIRRPAGTYTPACQYVAVVRF